MSVQLDEKAAPAGGKAGRQAGDRFVKLIGDGATRYEDLVQFGNNFVITSQYTWYTFLPVNLFQQFLNLANVYFLLIGALQIVPAISTTNGNPTMYQPLAFIIFVSALRAAKEDYDKHRSDAARNGYRYQTLRGQKAWEPVQSGDLAVGDIVKVMQNEMIPADMVIIGSALAQGDCFIDKANLNGETRLEVVSSLIPTRDWCTDETKYYLELVKKRKADELDPANKKPDPPLPPLDKLSTFKAEMTYEPPNKNFDTFRGIMTVEGLAAPLTLDGKCLLMRETNLRNCPYIYGIIVYTGNDTKIQMSNSQGEKAKVKKSKIMRLVDRFLVGCLLFQVALCIIAAIIAGVWHGAYADDMWYLGFGMKDSGAPTIGVLAFFTWFIILCQMVPISLIVSAEMVKFIQSVFISMDATLYYGAINKPTKCNSSTIHEDLGLVDYVFSDKTGTLTQNKMTFRYALMTFGSFGSAETEISKAVKLRQNELQQRKALGAAYVPPATTPWTTLVAPFHTAPNPRELDCCEVNCTGFQENCWAPEKATGNEEVKAVGGATTFSEAEKQALLNGLWRIDPKGDTEAARANRHMLKTYMIHMALSNTVKPYMKDGKLQFQAESAEEAAMVVFARDMGFLKKKTLPTVLEITTYDGNVQNPKKVLEEYNHVATLGFTSERARVTVIYVRTDNPRCPAHANPGCDICVKCPMHGNARCQESTCRNGEGQPIGDWKQGWDKVEPVDNTPVHIMTKGQDAKVLPLLKSKPNEVHLMTALTGMCNNGLRTLVCGFGLQTHDWWLQFADQYDHISQMGPSKASEGHGENPRKCQRDKCEKCLSHELYQKIEMSGHLQYLGCTGLEDQLQQLVPECIQDCLRAGIKVWMITGDKLETARNIGMACNLIDSDMAPQIEEGDSLKQCVTAFSEARLLEITGQWASLVNNRDELTKLFRSFDEDNNGKLSHNELQTFLKALKFSVSDDKMRALLEQVDKSNSGVDCEGFIKLMQSCRLTMFDAVSSDINEAITRVAQLVAEGKLESYPVSILVNRDAFTVMFDGKTEKEVLPPDHKMPTKDELDDLKNKFFKLASISKSLVFAQALPTMKKRMVTEIQARVPDVITLAIGDGANDVDMIMAAHVGVGISGIEGTAATNSADYAIGTFRMLHTLLFVHGFWSYQRMASLVTFIFYKASLVAITMYFFGFFSGFSGTQFFNDAPYQLYNVMYTALPVIATAVLDRSLPAKTLENTPEAYAQAKGQAFTATIFFRWIFRSCLHALCIFFVIVLALDNGSPLAQKNGQDHDLWFTSTVVYYAAVMLPTCMILFEMFSWTFLHMMAVLSSVLSVYLVTLIINVLRSLDPDLYGVVDRMYASGAAWFALILAVAIPLLAELVARYTRRHLMPSYTERMQEYDYLCKQSLPSPGSGVQAPLVTTPSSPARHDANKHEALQHLQKIEQKNKETAQKENEAGSDKLQASLIKAMLRFRNLTGSQYDSAAQARLQTHDQFDRAPRPQSQSVAVARGGEAKENGNGRQQPRSATDHKN